jgi:hypothetical protein
MSTDNQKLRMERDSLRDENYDLRHAPRPCSFCGEYQGHAESCWTVETVNRPAAAERLLNKFAALKAHKSPNVKNYRTLNVTVELLDELAALLGPAAIEAAEVRNA